ncbi:unnamed protein product, partial [Allacma fusca]
MERLVDRHLRTHRLMKKLRLIHQFAYMKAGSTVAALHRIIIQAESALEHKEYALGAFVDVEGAFNNLLLEAFGDAL